MPEGTASRRLVSRKSIFGVGQTVNAEKTGLSAHGCKTVRSRRIRAQCLQSRLQCTSTSTTPCPHPRLTCPCPAAQLNCHVQPPTVVDISELRRWCSNFTAKPPFLCRHLGHQPWPYPEMWMGQGPKMSKPQGIREGLLATGSRVLDSHRLCLSHPQQHRRVGVGFRKRERLSGMGPASMSSLGQRQPGSPATQEENSQATIIISKEYFVGGSSGA